MAAIARGQENTTDVLNWYTRISGVLTDMFEVGYQIWDVTGGYPGTQIFPAVPGDWEDVTLAPGRFSVGSYYAYDNGNAQGWTPDLGLTIGTHLIKWRWKAYAASPYQAGQEEFEVLSESVGSTTDLYCTVQDIRDLGVTVAQASDDLVLSRIKLAQGLFEKVTGQWFVPKTLQFKFDGTDSDAIHFSVPIISIEWLKINREDAELSTDLYEVYNGRDYPDDRGNPRIKLVGPDRRGNIFVSSVLDRLIFYKGRKNQEVRGVFGYTKADGTVPELVKEAVCRLTIERLGSPAYGTGISSGGGVTSGLIAEEVTDGHKIKYATPSLPTRKLANSGLTSDVFVQDVIRQYRVPMGIGVVALWSMR